MKSISEMMNEAKKCPQKRVVIAAAQDPEVLEAAKSCHENGIASMILIGDTVEMQKIASDRKINLNDFEVIHETDKEAAAKRAVFMCHSGEADILMKGAVHSSVLLKPALDKATGLRTGRTLSHVTVFQSTYNNRLMLMTDPAMNIIPTFGQKVNMVENAVCVARAIGIDTPKVAVVCGQELVNPDMPSTVDAALLCKMAERGQIKNCVIDGPLSLDLALSREAARSKDVTGEVAGQADILVLANLEAANVLYKALVFFAGAKTTGAIVGAKVPIVFTSRSDTYEVKLGSVALSVLIASKNELGQPAKS